MELELTLFNNHTPPHDHTSAHDTDANCAQGAQERLRPSGLERIAPPRGAELIHWEPQPPPPEYLQKSYIRISHPLRTHTPLPGSADLGLGWGWGWVLLGPMGLWCPGSCHKLYGLVRKPLAALPNAATEPLRHASNYTMALNLVPGDFKVHWEAKRRPSEPFGVSLKMFWAMGPILARISPDI